jgi:TonB family protein
LAIAACSSALALRMNIAVPARAAASLATDSPERPKKINVRPDLLTVVKKVTPTYPGKAKKDKNTIDGDVELDVIIGTNGTPKQVDVKKSLREDYDESAVDAVQQWVWQPFLLNGEPIDVETTITVTYSIKK